MCSIKTIATSCILFLVTLITPVLVSAQSGDEKFETGIQFSVIGPGGSLFLDDDTSMGGGGRITYNLTRYIALEGEMNYFPSTGLNRVRRLQGQYGIKSGMRFTRFGLFGKIRPGFQKIEYEVPVFCNPDNLFCPLPWTKLKETGFALDLGGVLEFYPAKRITIRFDVGDTILNRDELSQLRGIVELRTLPQLRDTSHTLQFSTGVGYRF